MSALLRLVTVLVLTTALAFSLVAGSYSGILHAHEHADAALDHHHHDDDDDANEQSKTEKLKSIDAGAGDTALDQTHEHKAELVLCMTKPISCPLCAGEPTWSPSLPPTVVIHEFGPSERPPRHA